MARIATNTNESIFQIKRWMGVNEAPEGEARLRQGEAAVMRNFKVTPGGALRKRGGSENVAGLRYRYEVMVDEESREVLHEETGYSDLELTMYPAAKPDGVGKPIGDGEPVTVTYENAVDCAGYYYEYQGQLYQLVACEYTPPKNVSEGNRDFRMSYGINGYWAFNEPPVFHNGEWNWDDGYSKGVIGRENGVTGWAKNETFYIVEGSSRTGGFMMQKEDAISLWKVGADEEWLKEGRYVKYTLTGDFELNAKGYWAADGEYITYASAVYSWVFHTVHSVPCDSADMTGREAESGFVDEQDAAVRGIWSGFVGDREVLCAACNGYLWELKLENGVWSKMHCGDIDTSRDVTLFGFDEKLYILAGDDNNRQYKVWDGTTMEDVEGYRPLVVEAATPAGKGTEVERANLLTGAKRMRFSPDGTAKVFQLPEKGIEENSVYVKLVATGENMTTGWTADEEAGTVTFEAAPGEGTNSLEIGWTSSANGRDTVTHMRYMELYNGAQDSRVFLYGDGTNRCIYSGLDSNGQPRADYFPDYNVAHVGEANTPITAMIRHYNKLLAFKLDSAWSISYDTLSLADGRVTAAFMITPVNRSVGNCAPGQAVLVENQPRTLDGRSVMEWKAGSNGSFTGDERNAQRVSQRVDSTIRSFDLETAKTFYDKVNHEYYVIGADGTALVNGIDADAWYIYTDFAALCMINYKDELYFGTADGYLRHFTENVYSDNGEAIDCYWESGSMPFERDYMRKYSAMIWVGIKPEEHGYLKVTAETDRKSDFAEYSFSTDDALSVPKMHRIKLKAKKFTYYKLVLQNKTADTTATVVSADVRVRNTGYVR